MKYFSQLVRPGTLVPGRQYLLGERQAGGAEARTLLVVTFLGYDLVSGRAIVRDWTGRCRRILREEMFRFTPA